MKRGPARLCVAVYILLAFLAKASHKYQYFRIQLRNVKQILLPGIEDCWQKFTKYLGENIHSGIYIQEYLDKV